MRRRFAKGAGFVVALVLGGEVGAQTIRPGDARPEAPEPAPAPTAPSFTLPPIPEATPEAPLHSGLRLYVARYEIVGSTVFDDVTLRNAVARYNDREVAAEELLAARDAITRLYIDAGYPTSGAVLPDQDPQDGVVRLEVVEGALARIEVEGNEHFRDGYFTSRLRTAGRAPLQVEALEAALQQIQRHRLIERVDAVLEPGLVRGESILRVTVREGSRFRLGFEGGNGRSPSVGSLGGVADGSVFNLVGFGEALSARGEISEGVADYEVRFDAPITPWDTRAAVRYRETRIEIVEEPFDDLEIESEATTWGAELEHPVYRSDVDEVWLGVVGEMRDLETEVLGFDFCFEPDPGFGAGLPSCSGPSATIVRGTASWTRRTPTDVVALRALASFGIDAFGATIRSDDDLADGRFVSGLVQGQWIHVLPESLWGSHLLLRGDLQLSDDPLLSFERFAIGGRATVRGYRENQLVTDAGVIASAELRVPVWRDAFGIHRLEVVPFMDFGHGWNEAGADPVDDVLWSAGVGLRAQPVDGLFAEAWWGGQLERVDDPNRDLQDDGFHIRVRVDVP